MKKVIIITVCLFLLFAIGQTVQGIDLIIDKYPHIEGAKSPSEGATLPEIIKYIYMFALGAAGITALLAMLIGAIMYIFSTGNPSKAADAKDRILSALLGILILLASVMILRIINPDLINIGFTLPKIGSADVTEFMASRKNTACFCFPSGKFIGCFTETEAMVEC